MWFIKAQTVYKGPWLSISQMSSLNLSRLHSLVRSSSSPLSDGETKAQRVRAGLDLGMQREYRICNVSQTGCHGNGGQRTVWV